VSRLYAIAILGWHFFLHYLQKLTFLYDPGGIEQFRENFDDEGLYSLDEDQREHLADWQRCIGCGLCEAECSELDVIPEQRHRGPRYVALASSRDLAASELSVPAAEAIENCDGDAVEAVCPVDIPVLDLAEFLCRTADAHEGEPG